MHLNQQQNNKKKIFNDPVYGFISIPNEILFDIIQHPYFQRLRRIKQLGLTELVYPGALHTRFHHALGAMHLMNLAIQVIRRKGHEITKDEEIAVLCAILLHDIGHGPFSHTLEHDIIPGIHHEQLSGFFMQELSKEFPILELSLEIFQNNYHKEFLYQLVSSQLDMDRLDYLNRDSFYTGVSEGVIGSDRLIEMLNVKEGQLVLEEKGIYSVEKFIVARRLMYWQVYLHKTVVAAEFMLIHIIRRAKELKQSGVKLFASPSLDFFLSLTSENVDYSDPKGILEAFASLDDNDVMGAIKVWQHHDDQILSTLSTKLVQRDLLKIKISETPFPTATIAELKRKTAAQLNCTEADAAHFVYSEKLTNHAYTKASDNPNSININLLMKDGSTQDLSVASDNLNISALSNPVEKYCLIALRM